MASQADQSSNVKHPKPSLEQAPEISEAPPVTCLDTEHEKTALGDTKKVMQQMSMKSCTNKEPKMCFKQSYKKSYT